MMLIAHQGASAVAPENTIAAIKEALFVGVDFVEVDVRLSKDQVPVLMHDASLARTTDCKEPTLVENLTLQELKQLDAGSWFDQRYKGEKIPTLEEAAQLDFGTSGFFVEIKEGIFPPKTIVSSITNALKNRNADLNIGTLSLEICDELLTVAEEQNWLVVGIISREEMLMPFRQKGLKRLAIRYDLLNPTLIQMIHEEGSEVWAFTIDDLEKARFLHSIHVDGILTNSPRKLISA